MMTAYNAPSWTNCSNMGRRLLGGCWRQQLRQLLPVVENPLEYRSQGSIDALDIGRQLNLGLLVVVAAMARMHNGVRVVAYHRPAMKIRKRGHGEVDAHAKLVVGKNRPLLLERFDDIAVDEPAG